jgi:hypothetical protein
MLGYWLGAMLTGVASGLAIVFALKDTGAEHTTRQQRSICRSGFGPIGVTLNSTPVHLVASHGEQAVSRWWGC